MLKFNILESRLQSLIHEISLMEENETFLKNKLTSLISTLNQKDEKIKLIQTYLISKFKLLLRPVDQLT
jgi:predicted nuclease with TOPRIM domain